MTQLRGGLRGRRNLTWRAVLALCAIAGGSASATAQESPWSVGATLSAGRDSNVLRTTEDEVADTTLAAGLRGSLALPLGRQTLLGQARVDSVRYQDTSSQDADTYDLGVRLRWETVERLSGDAGFGLARTVDRIDRRVSLPDASPNANRRERLFARAQLGGPTRWTFDAGVETSRQRASQAEYRDSDLNLTVVEAGARYQPSPGLSIRGLLRRSDGEFPTLDGGLRDEYVRNDAVLFVVLDGGAAWRFEASAGAADEDHTLGSQRDGSFATGSVSARWMPTGKLSFTLGANRDRDTGASGSDEFEARVSDALRRTRWSLEGRWQATSRIAVGAALSRTVTDRSTTLDVDGRSTGSSVVLTANYELDRAFGLFCRWERSRQTGDPQVVVPFDARTMVCGIEAWLR